MPTGIYLRKKGHKRPTISQALKGRILTEEWKRKIGLANKGRKKPPFTEEAKRKMSEAHKGNKNPNWNNGSSFEPYSLDWTETLRRSIRERDKYICQLCGKLQGDRAHSVHHIDYNKINCNPDNLISLCAYCNSKVNKNRNYWTDYFRNLIKSKKI